MKQVPLYVVSVISLVSLASLANGARPVYNIAHMVNTRSQIDEWLNYGANAIETDVTFDDDGVPEYFYHGFPCDYGRNCWRWDYIPSYIQAIKSRTIPSSPKFNSKFVLLMFDLKSSRLDKGALRNAGKRFADIALIPLYSDQSSKLKVIFSIQDIGQEDLMTSLLARLKERRPDIIDKIGFEIHSEENLKEPEDLENFYKKLGILHGHVWLSEGVTNWYIPWRKSKIMKELKSLVQYKENGDGYFSKVYVWSVTQRSTAKTFLETGIDGMITNDPRNVVKAIEDFNKELGTQGEKRLRLATLEDDPFERSITI